MMESSSRLPAHEAVNDFRPRGDDLRIAGRDPAQRRGPVRSPAAWRVAGGTGAELPTGRGNVGRCAPVGGKLGPSLRRERVCGIERWRAGRTTVAVKLEGSRPSGGHHATQSGRLRITRPTLEWALAFDFSPKAVRCDHVRAQLPTAVSPVWLPPTPASPHGGPSRPDPAGGSKKNSKASRAIPASTSGRSMRSTFNNTAADDGCGFPRKSRTRSAAPHRPENRLAILGRSGLEMASFAPPSRKVPLMLKPVGIS